MLANVNPTYSPAHLNSTFPSTLEIDDLKVRKPNFSEAEKMLLVRQYGEYRKILSSRQLDTTAVRMKQEIWQMITNELNRGNPSVTRTPSEVRKKWQNLLAVARREYRVAEVRGFDAIENLPWLVRRIVELGDAEDGSSGLEQTERRPTGDGDVVLNNIVQQLENDEDAQLMRSVKNEPRWTESPKDDGQVQELEGPHSAQPSPVEQPVSTAGEINCLSTLSTAGIAVIAEPAIAYAESSSSSGNIVVEPPPRKRPCPASVAVAETNGRQPVEMQRWMLEKARLLQELAHQRDMFEIERRKGELENELLSLQKAKLQMEVESMRRKLNAVQQRFNEAHMGI